MITLDHHFLPLGLEGMSVFGIESLGPFFMVLQVPLTVEQNFQYNTLFSGDLAKT